MKSVERIRFWMILEKAITETATKSSPGKKVFLKSMQNP